MTTPIAIVGAACRYPDARTPAELWESVLACRQAFRRIPPERLQLDDYYSSDQQAPDRTYSSSAAVLTDWAFDRAAFHVARPTYDSTDLTHWLALEVAALALRDAGFDPPLETTGVIVGNTLTGDASRANALRLRWPYVRRAIGKALGDEVLGEVERRFKGPLAPVGEDTLAGGLSNTIAGRICNYFGFGGGGYTVDGACSSSLLAVIQACNALAVGDLDVAIAGGVDLSLDPFELIGFAKCFALARDQMWVYDRKSNGFFPGEGCGFVVLMRCDDAEQQDRRVYATVRGWGVSSDGHGGMTRPEVNGQRLALQRAYAKAGMDINTVALFEGHGTGTVVGDSVELDALLSLLHDGIHYVGSVKANIGHTKAAAGIAGLLKATLALQHGTIPPVTGCTEPVPALASKNSLLRVTARALPWPEGHPRRAAVSAMGFGGINTHVVLEGTEPARLSSRALRFSADEVFLFGGCTREEVETALARVAALACTLSRAELTDLASALSTQMTGRRWRAACVAATPDELQTAVTKLSPRLVEAAPRVAFLFPGQGSIPHLTTDVAQPAIVSASLNALEDLHRLGIEAQTAVGHSLGELTALCWAGAIDREQLIDVAAFRGRLMQAHGAGGAMAALSCGLDLARSISVDGVVVAAMNAVNQTVISGPRAAIDLTIERAQRRDIVAVRLPIATAFHSPAMTPAAEPLRAKLESLRLSPLKGRVFSTVTGNWITSDTSISDLLTRQLTAPVRFVEALEALAAEVDFLVEVGPGRVLSTLGRASGKATAASEALSDCIATAWMVGCDVDVHAVFVDRFARPFDVDRRPQFIASPCGASVETQPEGTLELREDEPPQHSESDVGSVLRRLIARQTDLGLDVIGADMRMLSDLHLSSVTVARVLAEAARELRVPMLVDPTSFANATIADVTTALEGLHGRETVNETSPADGIADWVRPFRVTLVPTAAHVKRRTDHSHWRFEGQDWPEARRLFERVTGRGVVAVLPRDDACGCIDILLSVRDISAEERLIVVQRAACGSAFARTLHLERPDVTVRIVNVQEFDDRAACWVADEAEASGDFCEAFYGEDGARLEPRLSLLNASDGSGLDGTDVLLVTGGGRGIGFETGLYLSRSSGAGLVLLGRSPASHPEVAANLRRLHEANVAYRYVQADVTELESLRSALSEVPCVTALLHAAGANIPTLIDGLDTASFQAAVSPKLTGFRTVLDAIDGDGLRLVLTYGSVIARTGMPGEAHYAFANEWLARLTSEFAHSHPRCRAACIEWSVWSGLGMGARLGSIDALRRRGVTPLPPEEAVRIAGRISATPGDSQIVVCGRLGDVPTFRFDVGELPLLRFLEQTRVVVPGVELVVEANLSARSDPYLPEHVFGGEPLLPAVLGLEAMAQASFATTAQRPSRVKRLELRRPVVVPGEEAITVRVATLAADTSVDVVLRSSETAFAFDHFRATFDDASSRSQPRIDLPASTVDLDPTWVYDTLLFHTGRFRRISRYRAVTATECIADIRAGEGPWFHRYLPSPFLLGDPGVRDAAIHAIQVCVPQAVVLPEGIEEIEMFAAPGDHAVVVAREVAREDGAFVFDVDLAMPDGPLIERWHRLRLRAIRRREVLENLPFALWAPFLERELETVQVRIGGAGAGEAMREAAAAEQPPVRRSDGKPLFPHMYVSASTDGGLALAVAGEHPVGCDLQFVDGQPWREIVDRSDLRLVDLAVDATHEDTSFAAARIWSARESVKKLAGNALAPLVLDSVGVLRRVNFTSGPILVNTFILGHHVVAIAHSRSLS